MWVCVYVGVYVRAYVGVCVCVRMCVRARLATAFSNRNGCSVDRQIFVTENTQRIQYIRNIIYYTQMILRSM
jgi:hypothetical protein